MQVSPISWIVQMGFWAVIAVRPQLLTVSFGTLCCSVGLCVSVGGRSSARQRNQKHGCLLSFRTNSTFFYSCISRHSSLVSLHLRQLGRSLVEAIGQTRSGLVSITPVWPALIVGSATVQRYLDLILRASIEEPSSCRRCACVVAVSCPIYKARSAHSRWNFTSA